MSTADKLIGRLPSDERRKILDAIAHARGVLRGDAVIVEHTASRKLSDARALPCRVVGVAYVPGGSCDLALVVDPIDPTKRMIAIPAAHVCRVRWASVHDSLRRDPAAYVAGEVLAGPPLERTPA